MGKAYYSLRIKTSETKLELISKILRIEPQDLSNGWIFEIIKGDNEYYDFINEFLNI